MECILQNTDIFDEDIAVKFKKVIMDTKDNFSKESIYKVTVSFHVNLLNDIRFRKIDPIMDKISKGTKKDKVYHLMNFQLKRLVKVLEENGIEVHSRTIQGDSLKDENTIKIDIKEDTYKPTITGRKNRKKGLIVTSIIPSLPFIQKNYFKACSEIITRFGNE